MKRRKRIISIALVCSMLFGIPVMAAEEDIENDYDVEATSSEWLKSVDAKKMEPIYLSPEEILCHHPCHCHGQKLWKWPFQ